MKPKASKHLRYFFILGKTKANSFIQVENSAYLYKNTNHCKSSLILQQIQDFGRRRFIVLTEKSL